MLNTLKKTLSSNGIDEIVKKGGLSFFLRIFSSLFSYLFFYYLARRFNDSTIGLFQLSNSILIISSLFVSLGFQRSVVRFASRMTNEGNYQRLARIIKAFLKRILVLSLILGLGLILFSDYLSTQAFDDPEMKEYLVIIGMLIPLYVLYLIFTEFYRGINHFRKSELFKHSFPWLLTILICLVLSELSDFHFVPILAYALAFLIILLYAIPNFWKIIKRFERKGNQEDQEEFNLSYYLKTSYPMIITSLSFILLIRMDLIMLGFFENVDMSELGKYGIAVKLGILVNFANQALQRMAAPRVSQFFWGNKRGKLDNLIYQIKRINFFISFPIFLVLIFFTEELLGIFGPEYVTAAVEARVIAIAYFVNSYFGLAGIFMNMTGNQNEFMIILLITIVLNFILNLLLIPSYDILGPAISTCLCFLLWNVVTTIYLYRKYKIKMYYIPFFTKA